MGLSIATLQQKIHDRREQQFHIDKIELGQGFSIEAERGMLFLIHDIEPGEKAFCGLVENTTMLPRWVLFRSWYRQLTDTFGELPANVIVDGDEP